MRFLVDIPEDDLKWLDARAKEQGTSRAALIREAVTAYLETRSEDWLDKGFGLWAKYGFNEDGLDYENRLRDEWVREWDPEYDPKKHGPSAHDDAA